MARLQRAVLTNRPEAQEAAEECLKNGGSALDAALAAYFAVAAVTPWGLLAPVTILVAGSGVGVRAVDGRARQPGQGIERPVRYQDEASAPDFTRASAPGTAAAISLAASMFGRQTLVRLAHQGARLAKKQGARTRAAMIERLGSAKAWALQDRAFLAEVAERVPRFEGALLQPADLTAESVEVVACEPTAQLGGLPAALPPWHDPTATAPARALHLVSERGSLAGVISAAPTRSIALFDGELELPALAEPMLKSVPRLRPGTPLPMSAPLAALFDGARAIMLAGTSEDAFNEAELAGIVAQRGLFGLSLRAGQTLACLAP